MLIYLSLITCVLNMLFRLRNSVRSPRNLLFHRESFAPICFPLVTRFSWWWLVALIKIYYQEALGDLFGRFSLTLLNTKPAELKLHVSMCLTYIREAFHAESNPEVGNCKNGPYKIVPRSFGTDPYSTFSSFQNFLRSFCHNCTEFHPDLDIDPRKYMCEAFNRTIAVLRQCGPWGAWKVS